MRDEISPEESTAEDVRWFNLQGAGEIVVDRSRVQVDLIVAAFQSAGVSLGVHLDEDGVADFMYNPKVVLTRARDAQRVYAALGLDEPIRNENPETPEHLAGLHVVVLPDDRDAIEVLDDLDVQLGLGAAVPDHLMHVCSWWPTITWCNATEPSRGGGAAFAAVNRDELADGSRALVAVVDTGAIQEVIDDNPDVMTGVIGEPEAETVGHYSGHGTFVAGIVRTYAPEADVRIKAAFSIGGAVFESSLAQQLGQVLDWSPDIIDISAGTHTRRNLPPLALEVFWEERLSQVSGTVLVAAAGNDFGRLPFWPAAFPWVLSVGALDRPASSPDSTRAAFSNYGSWVDLYADGVEVESVYPRGTYTYREPPRAGDTVELDGRARWSGTSFSAPQVAGLVAARMTWSGESGRDAATSLLDVAKLSAIPHVGAAVDERIGARPADRGATPEST